MEPKFGDMFYSEFFKSNCVVVRYEDQHNWYFVVETKRHPIVLKAQARPEELVWIRN